MARPTIYGDAGMGGTGNTRSNPANNPSAVPGTWEWWNDQQGTPYTPPTRGTGNDFEFPWENPNIGGGATPPPTTPIVRGTNKFANNAVNTQIGSASTPFEIGGTTPIVNTGGTGTAIGDGGTPRDDAGVVTPPADPNNPSAGDLLFGDWQTNANNSFDPQALLDMINQLPNAGRNAELYAPLIKELQGLIASKGQSGLVSVDDQFNAVKGDIVQASDEQFRRTMGNLARTGTLESGGLREARIRENIALNRGLATERVAIETANSQQAAEKYSQALTQMQSLQEQAAKGEIDWFQAAVQMNSLSAENQRAWAQMGLSERLTMTGYDVEKYKVDTSKALEQQRINLEKQLGFAELDLKKMMEANSYDIEKTKIQLQQWMTQGGWNQQDADRALGKWSELLRAEVQNKRTDVDMINAMGKLTRDQWEREIAQTDLELKRYLGQQEYDLRRQELGQDWNKFLQQQATTRWMASNQWEVDKWIAKMQSDQSKQGSSFFGDLLSFAGSVLGGPAGGKIADWIIPG